MTIPQPAAGSAAVADREKLINELAATKAPNTVRRVYTVLRAIFALAHRRHYLAGNAADDVKLPKKAPKNKQRLYLSAAEVRALAEAMPERYRVATYTAAYCGELWALRRKDVDLLHGELHVRQALKDINSTSAYLKAIEKGLLFGLTKTHAERKLSLPAPIKAMLADHLAGPIPGGAGPDALIFTAPEGGPVRHGLFYRRVFKPTLVGDEGNKDPKKRRKAALSKHLHGLRWHDLRHTCAALSLEVQPNLAMVQARLGHEDIRTTILGAAVGYGAYRANAVGWWLALPAWIVAGTLALAVIVGIVSPPDASSKDEAESAA